MIIYDGNGFYQSTVNSSSPDDFMRLIPPKHDVMFIIQDDVEVLDGDYEELESRSL